MRALKNNSVAILVDIQERLVPAMNEGAEVVTNSANFIRGLHILEIPIIAARQYPKGLGELVKPIREALGEHETFDKGCFSVYDDKAAADKLHSLEKKHVFVFGIETHVCVLQTVIDLQSAGYQVHIVSDCCSSRKESDHQMGMKRAMQEGALITTREAALFELLRASGGEQFKGISNLVKEL